MIRVNPPLQLRRPQSVDDNKDLAKAFYDLSYIVNQLLERTGGGEDWIDQNRTGLYEFDDLASLVNSLLPGKPDVKVATSDYTTIGTQTIICTDALIVSLNTSPADRELVKVIISNGDVTVNGNGKLINKDTDLTVIFKNLITTATLDIVYILETDEWFII